MTTFTITRFELNDADWTTDIDGVVQTNDADNRFFFRLDGAGPDREGPMLSFEFAVDDYTFDFILDTCSALADEVYTPARYDEQMMKSMVGGLVRPLGDHYEVLTAE